MLSGSGRTILNLLDAIEAGRLNAELRLAIASRECEGAQRLRMRGVAVEIVPGVIPAAELLAIFRRAGIEWVALGGYLKYVNVPAAYRGRIVNIHPSLLPKFGGAGMYGLRVHRAVIDAKEAVSGCTVHLVDQEFDHGAIVLQRSCVVQTDDTPESLAARVLEQECIAFPEALHILMS